MLRSLESLEAMIDQQQTQIIRDSVMLTSLYFMHDAKYYDVEDQRYKYHPKPPGWRQRAIVDLQEHIDVQMKEMEINQSRVTELKKYLGIKE